MRINIKTKNIELNKGIEDFINEKIGVVEKFIKSFEETNEPLVEVEIEKDSGHHNKGLVFRTEAQIQLHGKNLIRAEERGEDLFSSIVAAKKELEAEIKKYKVKMIDKVRRPQQKKGKIT